MIYAQRADELYHDHKGPAVVAMVYLYKGDYDQAIELYLKRPNRDLFELAEAYTAKGMYKEALEQVQKSLPDDHSLEPWSGYPRLASAYALAGRRDEALKILHEEQQAAKERYISPFNFAIIYTGLGDKDRAFEYLNKAYEAHVLELSHFMYGPFFESLHSDPRYADLLRRMKLTS
jgi:tetratricopeptide (TPR) repeat protein